MKHSSIALRNRSALMISEVFSPFFIAAALTTTIALATDPTPLGAILIPLVFITLIPQGISIYLHLTKRVTDRFIMVRKQRTPFYIATIISIMIGVIWIHFIDTSMPVRLILDIALGTCILVTAINLKIKISIHALMTALLAVVLPFYTAKTPLVFLLGFIIWGVTVWSRSVLKRHSTPELVMGSCAGVLVGWLFLFLQG